MKKAFTLFELMLVVVIIGVVYALMIQNFNFGQLKEEGVGLGNLPAFLRSKFDNTKEKVTFRCMDDCSICKIFIGQKETNELDSFFEKYSNPNIYKLIGDNLEKVEFLDYVKNDKKMNVCFEYNLYPNKSTDKMILQYKDDIYMYDNFFGKTQGFKYLEDARDFWVKSREKAKRD